MLRLAGEGDRDLLRWTGDRVGERDLLRGGGEREKERERDLKNRYMINSFRVTTFENTLEQRDSKSASQFT